MLNHMLMPFRRFADFAGRSRRLEYWSFTLLVVAVYVVLGVAVFGTGASLANLAEAESSNPLAIYAVFFSGAGLLFAGWWLITVIPGLAVAVRRLHDRDISGWWLLGLIVANFIPVINMVAGIAFLVLLLLPGSPGPNRFGPDPKDTTSAEVFA